VDLPRPRALGDLDVAAVTRTAQLIRAHLSGVTDDAVELAAGIARPAVPSEIVEE
jgi:hypothetical protein